MLHVIYIRVKSVTLNVTLHVTHVILHFYMYISTLDEIPLSFKAHSRVTPGSFSLQLYNTHETYPHQIHSSLSQEGIHTKLSLTLFSLKPRK